MHKDNMVFSWQRDSMNEIEVYIDASQHPITLDVGYRGRAYLNAAEAREIAAGLVAAAERVEQATERGGEL